MQRIFNCDKIIDDIRTLDNVLNSLTHGSPFCVITYTSYRLSKMCGFWATLYTLYNHKSQLTENTDITKVTSGRTVINLGNNIVISNSGGSRISVPGSLTVCPNIWQPGAQKPRP